MPNVTVYFETAPEANAQRAAAEVQEKAAALPDVASASAQAMVTRGVDFNEIQMALQLAPGVIASATATVVALTALLKALQTLADQTPALNKLMVQVGLKKIPVAELTPHDMQKLAAG
jgi:hydrogenase-4 membrane subunit HyfE